MEQRQTAMLQQGIWIDQQRLAEAGLQAPVEIEVQAGEIRIRSAVAGDESLNASDESGEAETAWKVFRSLGRNAQPGRLADPSAHHDTYLYGSF